MKKIYFDVGANNGNNSIDLAGNPDYVVYAFEPTAELYAALYEKTKSFDNYHVFPFAVSDKSGHMNFNVAGHGDWGTSSLLEFSGNISESWAGREDLKVTDRRTVQVITLAEFCRWNKIRCIDYIHCDVQGMDLEVLMGLGEFLPILKAGILESARNESVKLYHDQKYTLIDCVLWLYQNGFKIDRLELNDQRGHLAEQDATLFEANEINIRYSRIQNSGT